jgi:hypothetical protein
LGSESFDLGFELGELGLEFVVFFLELLLFDF